MQPVAKFNGLHFHPHYLPERLLPGGVYLPSFIPERYCAVNTSPVFARLMIEENTKAVSQAAQFLRRRDIWIRWVIEGDSSLVARVVGVHLAMRMSVKSQGCWPNVKTMAKALALSSRHAQRGMLELEKMGALHVTRHLGKGNYYTLRLPTDP